LRSTVFLIWNENPACHSSWQAVLLEPLIEGRVDKAKLNRKIRFKNHGIAQIMIAMSWLSVVLHIWVGVQRVHKHNVEKKALDLLVQQNLQI